MDWRNVRKLKEEGEIGNNEFDRVERPDHLGPKNALESGIWREFLYESDEIQEIVEDYHLDINGEEAENYLELMDEGIEPDSGRGASTTKIGIHLTGYHISNGGVSTCRVVMRLKRRFRGRHQK